MAYRKKTYAEMLDKGGGFFTFNKNDYFCTFKIILVGRILAIDYGQKRVGFAATDDLQIIASGLTTVHVKDCIPFI